MDYEKELKKIFNKVGCNYEYLENHPKENLLSWNIGLVARDLLVIYFEITRKLNIYIPEEEILNGEFSTYEGIAKLIGLKSNNC